MSTEELSNQTANNAAEEKISVSTKDLSPEDRKMLRGIFLHSFNIFAMYCGGAKAGASGFLWALAPAFERFYPDKERRRDAMKRHSSWYNITSNVGTFCMGLVAAMEKENSEKPDFDTQSIDAIKASLMGPMSGIGDAIFWGVLRVIAAAVGMALCSETGSALGPIVFLLIYNIPSILCRWYLTVLGYRVGSNFITKLYEGGLMDLITKLAGILGLIMIGAMTASFVKFSCIIEIPAGNGDPVLVQTYLDTIFKGLVPILYTLGCLKLLRKNVNVTWLIIGTMVIGLLLGFLGIC
ncbi:MAG: PTS system mannose/fructose/sorbose family transporter subunit IID [Tractidigestivibacter sp.]|jgi:PTS system mannose-specific IID component|uniref:PTS system mannose/fructose/sorbose family transporter subunit IID n=1 Tax=Tractidigestivibacter sp. TaxID=2847320 RepID=UPI003D8C5827